MAENEPKPAPPAAESPKDWQESWDAARAEMQAESAASQVDEGVSEQIEGEGSAETAVTEQKAAPVEDPEHIKWAKSVNGHFDPKTGQLNVDRIAKQAHELLKALGQRDNQINQFNSLLQRPEMLEALARVQQGGKAQEKAKEPEGEQTDEAVLAKFVKETVDREYKPVMTQMEQAIKVLTTNLTRAKVNEARANLRSSLGKDESDNPLIDGVWDEVANTMTATAMRAGLDPNRVVEMLAANDQLETTMGDIAKQILFPRFREAASQAKAKPAPSSVPTETKKKLAVAPRPSSNARPAETDELLSFEESVAKARRELKSAAE